MYGTPSPEKTNQIQAWLDNPKVQAWIKNFRETDWHHFLDRYYDDRRQWLEFGGSYLREYQEMLTKDKREAETALFYIQQKKLWDLQVLWRAGQADVPGVRHTMDFYVLEQRIHCLDFLTPITPDEVEILRDWLSDFKLSRNLYCRHGWQNYRYYVDDNKPGEIARMPSLYDFWDMRKKIVPLWKILPDKKGKLEDNYDWTARMAENEKNKDPNAPPQAPFDYEAYSKPGLHPWGEHYTEFCRLVDDHHVEECRAALEMKHEDRDDDELKWAIKSLQKAKVQVPMEANQDWREAIIYASWKHDRTRLIDALDNVYQEYLFQQQLGIGYPEPEWDKDGYFKNGLDRYTESILNGREIKGEPRDFNF